MMPNKANRRGQRARDRGLKIGDSERLLVGISQGDMSNEANSPACRLGAIAPNKPNSPPAGAGAIAPNKANLPGAGVA
jgi:hypothetical protein